MNDLSDSAKKILQLIDSAELGYLLNKDLVEATSHTAPTISKMITGLEKKQLVYREVVGTITEYRLTEAGKILVSQWKTSKGVAKQANNVITKATNKEIHNLNSASNLLRLHALTIYVPFKVPLDEKDLKEIAPLDAKYVDKDENGNIINLRYYLYRFNDYLIKLTHKSITIFGKEAVAPLLTPLREFTDTQIDNTLRALKTYDDAVNKDIQHFKLLKKDLENYDYEIQQIHIAFTNDKIAKDATKISDPYELVWDEIGNVVAIADMSVKLKNEPKVGFPELEGYGMRGLSLMEKYQIILDSLDKNRWDPLYEKIQREQDRELLHQTNMTLKEYGEKLNAHLPVLENIRTAQDQQIALNKKLMETLDSINKKEEGIISRIWSKIFKSGGL